MFSQNYYVYVEGLCSTKIDLSEYTINGQEDAEYE